jgi:predicted DNA binding CopG/RHH family protein
MKKVPRFESDQAAEAFLDQDLSDLDFSQFKPMHFELEPKSASLNMRLPATLLDAVKTRAKARGIPYTRYVRMLLEADVMRHQHS